jgi:hypothetical protein
MIDTPEEIQIQFDQLLSQNSVPENTGRTTKNGFASIWIFAALPKTHPPIPLASKTLTANRPRGY